MNVLEKQSTVFKSLRENDEVSSYRGSRFGGAFFAQGSNPLDLANGERNRAMDLTANPSKADFFEQNLNNDEPIMTEMDLESNYPGFMATNMASKKFLNKQVSKDVLTDYDITDEVGVFQNTVRA